MMPDNKQLILGVRALAKQRTYATEPISGSELEEAADAIENLEADLANERTKSTDGAKHAEKAYEEVCAERNRLHKALAEVTEQSVTRGDRVIELERKLVEERKKLVDQAADAIKFAEAQYEEVCAERDRLQRAVGEDIGERIKLQHRLNAIEEGLLEEAAMDAAEDAYKEAPMGGRKGLEAAIEAALQHAQEQVDKGATPNG